MIASMDWDPVIANFHAQIMGAFFDGQTPLAVTLYNIALARVRAPNIYDEAVAYLKNSHWLLPTFEPTLALLNAKDGVSVRSRYKEGAVMRIAEDAITWKVRALLKEMEKLNMIEAQIKPEGLQAENLNLKKEIINKEIQLTLLTEKRRLGIPDPWYFDSDRGCFFDPSQEQPNNNGG
jgi:hypothetical protein